MSTPIHYDTIIIGAGSAGAILATRLSEDSSRNVLLIEAGPDYPDSMSIPAQQRQGFGHSTEIRPFAGHNWEYVAQATPQRLDAPIPRGKVIGGSSAVNGLIFLRGEPADYDTWAAMGNNEWSFQKVLPYFIKSENDLDFSDEFHGQDGPTPVLRYAKSDWKPDQMAYYNACIEMGFPDCPDHNRPFTSGIGPFPLNCVDNIRQSTAITYLLPARHRANLTIQAETLVHALLFDRTRAVGVRVEQAGRLSDIHGDEILLCAGATNSPQLLMLSGIGPADHLRALDIPVLVELPGVGQNLRDHPAVNMRWRVADDFPLDNTQPTHQVGLRYTADGSDLVNDMIIYVGSNKFEHILFMRPTINLAASAGELRLRSSDPTDAPLLNYRYFSEPSDQARQREAVRLCETMAHYSEFEAMIDSVMHPVASDLATDAALDQWIQTAADTGHHSSGTCKMGPERDPMAVVNQAGQVYGVENLRVIDASIMPDCVRANINAAVLMIGEKMADLLNSAP